MRHLILLAVVAALAAFIGFEFGSNRMQNPKSESASAAPVSQGKLARKIKYYWDPMLGPSSISDKPGKSAMGMDLVPVYEDAAAAADTSAGPEVRIDGAVVQNMGIRTAEVTRGPLTQTVRAVGILEIPQTAEYDVNLRINGWIEKLYADQEGILVHAGQPLFDLYSPDLQIAEEELISAIASLKSLDAGATQAARIEARSLVDSARHKLRLWGIAEQDIDTVAASATPPPSIPIRSPVNGELQEKLVALGASVQAGTTLMRIEDHSRLWLTAQVYERQMDMVKVGQSAEATFDSVPGRVFRGSVDFIYPHLDPETRTAMVRINLDNHGHELKPGMYATVNIVTRPVQGALLVPREAIIDTGTRQVAFVVLSQGRFAPRNIRMGLVGDDDRVEILDGLKEGETIVTSGQFLLDVSSRTTEALQKLEGTAAQ